MNGEAAIYKKGGKRVCNDSSAKSKFPFNKSDSMRSVNYVY